MHSYQTDFTGGLGVESLPLRKDIRRCFLPEEEWITRIILIVKAKNVNVHCICQYFLSDSKVISYLLQILC